MRQVAPRWQKPVRVILLVGCLLLAAGCNNPPPKPSSQPPEQPINVPHRPHQTIEFCPDYTFSIAYTQEAVPAVAENIVADTTVNQDGATVFVTPVTHDSLRNTLAPITIPALPADAKEPTYLAIPSQDPNADPLDYQHTVAHTQAVNQQAYTDWQVQLRANHQKLAEAIKQVQAEVGALRNLTVPIDSTNTDLFGCLQSAANHFQSQPGQHILVLDGDLVNTTSLQWSSAIALAHASVLVIWYYCQVARVCEANKAWWQDFFLRQSAASVQFYDRATSQEMRNTHQFFF